MICGLSEITELYQIIFQFQAEVKVGQSQMFLANFWFEQPLSFSLIRGQDSKL